MSTTNIDIADESYSAHQTRNGNFFKRKTLIYFCHHESEENVIKVLSELIDYDENINDEFMIFI